METNYQIVNLGKTTNFQGIYRDTKNIFVISLVNITQYTLWIDEVKFVIKRWINIQLLLLTQKVIHNE